MEDGRGIRGQWHGVGRRAAILGARRHDGRHWKHESLLDRWWWEGYGCVRLQLAKGSIYL